MEEGGFTQVLHALEENLVPKLEYDKGMTFGTVP